jgi:ubiquinone/menaquinone biosynthesis C-methylase UbiE
MKTTHKQPRSVFTLTDALFSAMIEFRPMRVLRFRLLPAILAMLAYAIASPAQAVHPVTGRRIASVMGFQGADWLERSNRDSEENTTLAVKELQLKPGMVVADIGAGTGYYSLKIARKVQPGGQVLAVDIQPEMLDRLRDNAQKAGVRNIQTILGTESDPKLPPGSVDIAILVDVYHELSRPQRVLQHIRSALKPDGELVLLEYRKEDPSVPIRPEHKMSLEETREEVQPEGYRFLKSVESLPWQHMIFFKLAALP